MRTFKSSDGTEWKIAVTFGAASSVSRADPRFNLYDGSHDVGGGKTLYALMIEDHRAFGDLLLLLISDQAETRGISLKQFGESLSGENIVQAQTAFLHEWHDFFLGLQKPEQAAALEKMMFLRMRQIELVKAAMKGPQVEMATKNFESRLQKSLNAGLGKLVEASESIPADSPSDN